MKKKLILLFVLSIFCLTTYSQQKKFDIILKTDGQEMIGKIQSISKNDLSFIYENEAIIYKVDKNDIVKITFSSGRIEFFNKFQKEGNKNEKRSSKYANLEEHHNKVAVLPFGYIKDDRKGADVMSTKIQNETYSYYRKYTKELKFQNPQQTNALLIKAGVSNNNIQGFTMGEICNILGVEYVIQGVVTLEKTTQTNYSNSSSTTTKKNRNKAYVNKKGKIIGNIFGNNKKSTNTSSYSTNVQNYQTSMIMNIFNDKGDNIYSKDHTAFWATKDAYRITLKYLAKRTPLYKR